MNFISTRLPYRETGYFKSIVLDYIDQSEKLKPFFSHSPSIQGIQKVIEQRKKIKTDRKLLVQEIQKQYGNIPISEKVKSNIQSLSSENSFTVTTAHQNNIFTGPLYFIYKIIHAIKLADHLNASMNDHRFIPVFYIGSEDADLDELNHIYLGGEKLTWETKQTGAVGRMIIDKSFTNLVERLEGELSVLPHGKDIVSLAKECYKEKTNLQDATFKFVNALFGEYGLIVLLPDNAALKKQMLPLFRDDLLHQAAAGIVEESEKKLTAAGYKTQAHPREINLFYLIEGMRERIVKNSKFKIQNSDLSFTEAEILTEMENHPERFSPNVILRGLYQESILPDVAFIGGGGELAYWLELKDLFDHYKIVFPLLVLRNSYLVVEKKTREKISKLGFTTQDFFLPEQELMTRFVSRESKNKVTLNGNLTHAEELYGMLKRQASAVDATLGKHVEALKTQTLQRLQELEKKMIRAEKRKFADQQRQIQAIKEKLFPAGGLQERRENLLYYYSKWGKDFIGELYKEALNLEQEFVILNEA